MLEVGCEYSAEAYCVGDPFSSWNMVLDYDYENKFPIYCSNGSDYETIVINIKEHVPEALNKFDDAKRSKAE